MSRHFWEAYKRREYREGYGMGSYPALGRVALGGAMYCWIDGQRWAEDGQPSLTEEHGFLCDVAAAPPGHRWRVTYGRILSDEEARVVSRALLDRRVQDVLPLEEEGV